MTIWAPGQLESKDRVQAGASAGAWGMVPPWQLRPYGGIPWRHIPWVGEHFLADHAGSWPIMQRIAKPGLSRGSQLAVAQLSIIMRYNRLSTRMPP